MREELILGIDPGSHSTGFGLIRKQGSRLAAVTFGCIRPKEQEIAFRYRTIFQEINQIIEQYAPHAVAVETQYVDKNFMSAMKLGMVRGIVMLAASLKEIPIFEYAPARAKKATTGNGRASKSQIHDMIQCLLNLKHEKLSLDAADALAIAIAHAQRRI